MYLIHQMKLRISLLIPSHLRLRWMYVLECYSKICDLRRRNNSCANFAAKARYSSCKFHLKTCSKFANILLFLLLLEYAICTSKVSLSIIILLSICRIVLAEYDGLIYLCLHGISRKINTLKSIQFFNSWILGKLSDPGTAEI